MMIGSCSSGDLDAPAFPLNFDPELLLNDESHTEDFHQWLQAELDLFSSDSEGDRPLSAQPDGHLEASSEPAAGHRADQELQSSPGIFELFQLQALARDANTVQHVQGQGVHWIQQQQHQQQPQQQLQKQSQQMPPYIAGYTATPQTQMQASQPYVPASSLPPGVAVHGSLDVVHQQYQLQEQHLQQQQLPLLLYQHQHQQYTDMQQPQAVTILSPQGIQHPMQQHYAFSVAPAVAYMPSAGSAMYGSTPASVGYLPPTAFMASAAPITTPPGQLMAASQEQQPAAPATAGRSGGRWSLQQLNSHTGQSADGTAAPVLQAGAQKPKGPSRRFRERQKETISSLEAEVTEKLAQLQALSAENEMLKLRSAVLEATVKGREYHMKIIKEHGPPVFNASESAQLTSAPDLQLPSGPYVDSSGCCYSGASAGHSGHTPRCSGNDTDGDTALDADRCAGRAGQTALSLSSPCAGDRSHASTAFGDAAGAEGGAASPANSSAAAAPAGVRVQDPAVPLVGVSESDTGCSLHCCDAPQMCSPAEQKKTIRTLKHMNAQEIIRHWKQFVHDVTGELLAAEQEQQQQRQHRQQPGAGSADAVQPSSGSSSAAASVAKVCRWCSCAETAEHTAEACEAQQQRKDEQQGVKPTASSTTVEERMFQASGSCVEEPVSGTATEANITALVNKYSYMTKFVALLNPGVLYHLYGRHLDTGLPAPYSDDHWRQVVSRLGLSKHQVTVILACAELYFSSMNKLLDQRRALQQQLQQADEGLSECQRRLHGVDGGLNQLQVLDALVSTLKREHVLRIMLNCFVWGRSLNSLQFAKSAVYSYPFFPDVHAMVCVLYDDARAMAPNGQPALVFPHRQTKAVIEQQEQAHAHQQDQQQQQNQLQAIHEQLRAQRDGMRAEAAGHQHSILPTYKLDGMAAEVRAASNEFRL